MESEFNSTTSNSLFVFRSGVKDHNKSVYYANYTIIKFVTSFAMEATGRVYGLVTR